MGEAVVATVVIACFIVAGIIWEIAHELKGSRS